MAGREIRLRLADWEFDAIQQEAARRGTTPQRVLKEVCQGLAVRRLDYPAKAALLQEQDAFLADLAAGRVKSRVLSEKGGTGDQ